MNVTDAALAELVRLLAAMPQADRDFVLAGLSESECARLLPLLTPTQGGGLSSALSPALSALIRHCETALPEQLTRRSADALVAAVRLGSIDNPVEGFGPPQKHAWWHRLTGRASREALR